MSYPTPHGDKLRALLENDKLPEGARPEVRAAIVNYERWLTEMEAIQGSGDEVVEPLTQALNRYKRYVDLELVFDSESDFLYRQKGQLKLDNTILEEFLPWMVGKHFPETLTEHGLELGPVTAFSQMRFEASPLDRARNMGIEIRAKDHDFALARPLFLKVSDRDDFWDFQSLKTNIAYVAAEIKTNLDKTMFQEASATAQDLKEAVPMSRYFPLM